MKQLLPEHKNKLFKNSNKSGIILKKPKIFQEKIIQIVYDKLAKVDKQLKKYDKVYRFVKDDLQEFIDKKKNIKE